MFLPTVRCLAIPWAEGRKIQHDLLLDGLAQRRPTQHLASCVKRWSEIAFPGSATRPESFPEQLNVHH